MKTEFLKEVELPSVDEFLVKYPRYSSLVRGEGHFLVSLIMQPDVLVEAQVLAKFGMPSVLAVAERCRVAIDSKPLMLDNFTKQCIGALICVLMEANGYKKTGTKKSVKHQSFTMAEYYVPIT